MKNYIAILLVATLAISARCAPVVNRWTVETSRPAPQIVDLYRGETIELRPTLASYGNPIDLTATDISIFWQTNGMGAAWWSSPATTGAAPGTIIATWSHTNDIGAAQYTFFIRARDPSGDSWRAHGILRMRHSPGWSPNAAPPPTVQWVTPSELQAVSNALVIAIQEGVGGGVASNYLPLAGGSMDADAKITLPGTGAKRAIIDPYEISVFDAVYDGAGTWMSSSAWGLRNFDRGMRRQYSLDGVTITTPIKSFTWQERVDGDSGAYTYASEEWVQSALAEFDPPDAAPSLATIITNGNHTAAADPALDTNAVISVRSPEADKIGLYGSSITRPGVEAYSTYAPAIVARSAVGPAILGVQGPVSNAAAARFAGVVEVVGEPSANEGAGQPGGIRLAGRTISNWGEIEASISQSEIDDLRAWGRRTPDGGPNPDASVTTINTPLMLASGLGWAVSGNYAVIINTNAEMRIVENGGEFWIGPAGVRGIGFKTIDVVVGAIANSFSITAGGTTNGYATISYHKELTATNTPTLVYTVDLVLSPWIEASEAQWIDNGDHWTVVVSAEHPRQFFKAVMPTGLRDVTFTALPHEFEAGIQVGGLAPVIYDSVLTIEHDGKTYRIPAEEVTP